MTNAVLDHLTPIDRGSKWLNSRRSALAALSMFLVLAAAAVGLHLVAQRAVDSQEERLLVERTADIQALIDAMFNDFRVSMEAVGTATFNRPDRVTAFRDAARPQLNDASRFAYLGLVGTADGRPVVTAAVGSGLPVDAAVTGPQLEAVERARRTPTQLVSTRLFDFQNRRTLGLAVQPTAAPDGEVIYGEINVRPLDPEVSSGATAYRGVGVALYASFSAEPESLVLATTENVPLTEPAIERIMHIGGDTYILRTNAQGRLDSDLAHALPLIVLLSGLATAVLVTVVVRVIQRRREYAMWLVEERTNALSESMRVLRDRAHLDALLRRASRDVAGAPDLNTALQILYSVLQEMVPADRVTLSALESGELRVRGSVGPNAMVVGDIIPMDPGLREQALSARGLTRWATADLIDDPDMRSTVMMPVASAGAPQALVSISTAEAEAYRDEHVPILESIGRETSAYFTQLLALEREREAAKRFQELDQLKSEFVGIVAHDLRSPMTVIAGFADLLRTGADDLSTTERNEYLERISTNVKNLAELVEDVLQVARIESGELKCRFEPFDLGHLIRTTAYELAHAQGARSVIVDVPSQLPMAFGDEQRQWQVLVNLLTNAFKFSPPGRPVEVRVTQSDEFIEVSITDHGIGIREEDVPRLFQKFSRVTQPGGGQKVGGTGLGLYIARSLVEAQKGTIRVETAEGEGSTFHYTVPLARVPS